MKTLEFLQVTEKIAKPFFTISDLEKITGLKRESLRVFLTRLAKRGLVVRLKKGLYTNKEQRIEEIASQLYQPCYLSFEAALSKYGILSQVPYSLTFATPRRTRKEMLGSTPVEYHQIKKELFFGFRKEGNLFVAKPEKALLDQLYLVSKGLVFIALDELSFSAIDRKQLLKMAQAYPSSTRKLIDRLSL